MKYLFMPFVFVVFLFASKTQAQSEAQEKEEQIEGIKSIEMIVPTKKDKKKKSTEEEEESLEADMETAQQKIDTLRQQSSITNESSSTPQFEEVQATSASSTSNTSAENAVKANALRTGMVGIGGERPWGIVLTLEHAAGTGTFIKDPILRERYDYIVQSWVLSPFYVFNMFDHHLKLSARFSFNIELTKPNSNPPRRFSPRDAAIGLSDPEVFKEPLTDISINASLSQSFPTSYESINDQRRWSATSAKVGARRIFGPLMLTYGLGFVKYYNSSHVEQSYGKAPASSSNSGYSSSNVQLTGTTDPSAALAEGFGSVSYQFSNSFSANYSFTDNLSLSYSLALVNRFKYSVIDNPDDGFSSPYADAGRGRSDILMPTLDLSYVLDSMLENIYPLPVSITASVGMAAMHPAQTANNESIMWPVFYQAFMSNRAANNYGSFYFNLVGVY